LGFGWELKGERQVCKECRNYWTSILLGHFWCKAILGIQFALLLFLRSLMSSILSFVTGLSFVVRRLLVEKHRAGYYCTLRTFRGNLLG